MKKNLLLSVLFIFSFVTLSFSQGQGKRWYFSSSVGLNFNTTPPTVVTNGAMTSSVGCSSIADAAGNLLFYTNGTTIWNQQHLVMANGTGLSGTPGAQNCIIVKQPANTSIYYIFTVEGNGGASGLSYSIVDLSLAAGNGSVTVKNATLFASPCEEKISAVRHCNQNDVWVMVHQMDTSLFRGYLLTATGVSTVGTVSNVGPQHAGPSYKGQLKFSPNGKRMIGVHTVSSYSIMGCSYVNFEFYDFNNTTGSVTNYLSMGTYMAPLNNAWGYGAEFSADARMFYYSYHGAIMQLDICDFLSVGNGAIVPLDNAPYPQYAAALQLGTDGKIYVANYGATSVGVINNPSASGNACNYQPAGISLGTSLCQFGLPNFLTSYFEKLPVFSTVPSNNGSCLSVDFAAPTTCTITGYGIPGYNWNFGDQAAGALNLSSIANPTHLYPGGGSYSVSLILNYPCGKTDTLRKVVTVTNNPTVTITTPSLSCISTTAIATTVGGIGPYSYTWTPYGQTGPVANNLTPGIYSVYVRDTGTGCLTIATTTLGGSILNATVVSNPLCATANTGSAGVVVTGGGGIFTWIGTTQSTPTVTGLSIGTHTMIYTPMNSSCVVTKTFQVTQSPPLTLPVVPSAWSDCAGKNIMLYSACMGGTPNYNYSWAAGPASDTYTVTQNLPGFYIYTVTVTDAGNCTISNTVGISFLPNPILSVSGNTTCLNTPALLTATGAGSYTWQPSGTNGNSFQANPQANTVYTLVGESNYCFSSITTTLLVNPLPVVNITGNTQLCAGQTLTLSGNTSGNSSVWTGPLGFSASTNNIQVTNVSANDAGLYSLVVTGANSCVAGTNVQVTVSANPTINIVPNQSICNGQSVNLVSGGALTYTWNTGATGPSVNVSPGSNTIYTVTGSNAAGCKDVKTVNVRVSACTGISEVEAMSMLSVYPNPGSHFVNISSEISFHLSLFTETGSTVIETIIEQGTHSLDISNLSKGLYFLKCTNGDISRVLKLVKAE